MRNGKEYQRSIQQQIVDLLDKAHLGKEERVILNKLNFGKKKNDFFVTIISFSFE